MHLFYRAFSPVFLFAAAGVGRKSLEPGRLGSAIRSLSDNSPLLYALLVVGVLLGAGTVLGVLIEVVLSLIGLETEDLNHAE